MFSTVHKVAGVGWLSDTSAESLRAFVERVFANFRDKNIVFYNCGKTGHLWLSKDLHTHRHGKLYESSPKAGSPKALRKLSKSSSKAGSRKAL